MSDSTALTTALAGPLTPARRREEVLTLTTVLPMSQQQVWTALTDPNALAKWSPIIPDRPLVAEGTATSLEHPAAPPVDATVVEAREPWYLEHHWGGDVVGWQLAPSGEGTQVNLVHQLARPESAIDTAAGWHVCLTVLALQAAGEQVERCVGDDSLDLDWDALRARYAQVIPDPAIKDDQA
ncbi:SRPBCC domain-containing protein [Luteococcus sanguinis]|uniref:SRPBCC domain-containing protein n=1 Tax=Luteococcus sanguinis TaxID=174038 RepID=A0ABW1WX44_9ACTN